MEKQPDLFEVRFQDGLHNHDLPFAMQLAGVEVGFPFLDQALLDLSMQLQR